MPITNPRLLPFSIASTSGALTAAQQVAIDATGFDGNLTTNTTEVQALAQALDDLTITAMPGTVAASDVTVSDTNLSGVLSGSVNAQTAFERLDATGIGSAIFAFTGNYSAETANIGEWFNNRAFSRLRGTGSGSGSGNGVFTFDLPGTTDLTTVFDGLVAEGLPEVFRLVIEYTGGLASAGFFQNRLVVQPRSSPNPQIAGTTNINMRRGQSVTLEITRTSGTISDYIFVAVGLVSAVSGQTLDDIELQNPRNFQWDASANAVLPTVVLKGYAYRVVNAPADGSGRFGEVMQDGDWVVWEGDTFTSWDAEPHQWFVIAAHDVRRISALESNFLSEVVVSPVSDRNGVVRGANYTDANGSINIKAYATPGDYSAADLNTSGDVTERTITPAQSAYLGIRLNGTLATITEDTLGTYFVYAQDSNGEFRVLGNMRDDFAFQGNFGGESDYLSNNAFNFANNDVVRVYLTSLQDRYSAPALDVDEDNLTPDVQAKLNRTDPNATDERSRLAAVESKLAPLVPLTVDVSKLTAFSDIFDPERTAQTVTITDGYSLIADYRGAGTRYESAGVTYDDTGVDVVRYTGLGDDQFRSFGFKVPQIDTVTLTGTSGTANITINTVDYLATFNTDLATTASDFVTTHSAALNTAGIIVTSDAEVLTFTQKIGSNARASISVANATGDLAGTLSEGVVPDQDLLSLVDGSEIIPFVRVTSSGTYEINNFVPSTVEDQRVTNQTHKVSVSGQSTLRAGSTDTATITVTNFPANATQTSRSVQLGLDVLVNGADTLGEHLATESDGITIPADNTAQALDTFDASIFLGYPSNRTVNVTMSYEARVSGNDLLLDVKLVSAPSDVTISIRDTFVFLSYTAPAAVARVDNYETLGDGAGTYTFTGENELLISFHPFETQNFTQVVPVAINSSGTVDQLNDVRAPFYAEQHFGTVEIPDQTAFSGFEFRTFAPEHFLLHSDLAHLITRRATQWSYGLALLEAITENAITEEVDFTQGVVIIASPNNTRVKIIADDSDTSNIKIGLQEV